jgi:ribosomal-protein-alanine N-acetyltransferase
VHRVGDVVLRAPEQRDVDSLLVIKNDREIASMLGGHSDGYTRDGLRRWVDFHRSAKDESFWVIVDPQTDRCLGHVALYKIDPRIGSAEFAILVGDRAWWGKGVGRDCTAWLVNHAFTTLNLRRVYLEVLATNERAAALYRKLGFKEEGRLRQHQLKGGVHVDVVVMGILRDEWRHGA